MMIQTACFRWGNYLNNMISTDILQHGNFISCGTGNGNRPGSWHACISVKLDSKIPPRFPHVFTLFMIMSAREQICFLIARDRSGSFWKFVIIESNIHGGFARGFSYFSLNIREIGELPPSWGRTCNVKCTCAKFPCWHVRFPFSINTEFNLRGDKMDDRVWSSNFGKQSCFDGRKYRERKTTEGRWTDSVSTMFTGKVAKHGENAIFAVVIFHKHGSDGLTLFAI